MSRRSKPGESGANCRVSAEHLWKPFIFNLNMQRRWMPIGSKKRQTEGRFTVSAGVRNHSRTKDRYLVERNKNYQSHDRLMAVLEVVNEACRIANPSKTPETYTAKGTISGYKI